MSKNIEDKFELLVDKHGGPSKLFSKQSKPSDSIIAEFDSIGFDLVSFRECLYRNRQNLASRFTSGNAENTELIADLDLVLLYKDDSMRTVTACIFKPYKRDSHWYCPFGILGLSTDYQFEASGSNSLKALTIAIARIKAYFVRHEKLLDAKIYELSKIESVGFNKSALLDFDLYFPEIFSSN